MRQVLAAVVVLILLSACLDVSLPDRPPPPGPGSVLGSIVFAQPGQSTLQPAVGASIERLGSGVLARVTDETGAFALRPVDASSGSLLIRFDGDGDGRAERQRLLALDGLGAGRGKTVSLGQVVVGSTGIVRGRVLRGDVAGTSGHGGTTVAAVDLPLITLTADDGSFVLETAPEGRFTVAIFRPGYAPLAESLTLRAQEVFTMQTLRLEPSVGGSRASVRGRVLLPDGAGASDVRVAFSGGTTVSTDADGTYRTMLPYDLYVVGFSKPEFLTATLLNAVVAAPTVVLPDVVLAPGVSTVPDLDGGRPVSTGGGAGGGAAGGGAVGGGSVGGGSVGGGSVGGGSVGGGSVGGGSVGGGSVGGGSIGGGSIGGGSVGGGSVGGGSVGGGSVGGGSVGGGSVGGGSVGGGSVGGGSVGGGSVGGGSSDGGTSDAGVDAGVSLLAIIDAPVFVSPNAQFTLSGQRSIGARPLIYSWSQDAGPTLTIANNNSPLAATPTLRAPGSATLLKFTLVVTDPSSQRSDPTSVFVPVAVPPVAVIDAGFPSIAYANQRVVLNGSGSTDPNGTGLTTWDWAVSPPGITVTPLGNGERLQLDMPPTVGTSVVVTTTLTVVNGLTLRSAPVSASFTLSSDPAPTWTLDAGLSRTVAGGSTVTLAGLATAPVPGTAFTYQWSPASDGPDGGPADWLLTNPAAQSTTFVAPRVDGPLPRLLPFTLTATETTGVLSPSSRSTSIVVSVIDRKPPVLVDSSIDSGAQGVLSAWLQFDEAIDPGSVGTFSLSLTPAPGSPPSNIVHTSVNGARVMLGFEPPLGPGFMYTLNVFGLTDRAPTPPNAFADQGPRTFIPSRRWSEAWESAASSTSEMWPGLAVRRPSGSGTAQVFVFARADGASWFGAPFDATRCAMPPCVIQTDSTAPAVMLTGPLPRGHKGVVIAGRPVGTLQLADRQGTPGVAFRYEPGGWQALPPPPGLIFTSAPGTVPYAIQVSDAGVALAALDGGTWFVQSDITSAADFHQGPTADPLFSMIPATAAPPGGFFVAARSSTGGNGRVFHSSNGASWTVSPQSVFGGSDPVIEVRSAMRGNGVGLLIAQRQSGSVFVQCEGAGTCGTNLYFSAVGPFDAVASSSAVYFVTATGGVLELWLGGTQSQPVRLPGPVRAGMPSTLLNSDPSCFADRPEVTMLEGVLYVTWQERCGVGPWRVYVRALQ